MKKKHYSEDQIVGILRETDRDTVPEAAKRHGVSEMSIYVWRKRFGAMGNEEVKNLKSLESENVRLTKRLAERDFEIEMMKEIAAKW